MRKTGLRRSSPATPPAPGALVARVATSGVDKDFDYVVPPQMIAEARIGTEVRVELHGRRVGGWIVELGVVPREGLELRPLSKIRGWGPEPEVVALAGWAAWRWAGKRVSFLSAASGTHAAAFLPPPRPGKPAAPREVLSGLEGGRPTILRQPPASDPTPVVAELAQRGPTLVVLPSAGRAAVLAERLRRAGGGVALLPDDWTQARAGAAVVVGARGAAWGPCPGLAAAVVIDGHDEALGQEPAPTWNAVGLVAERARRAGAACVVISACPTPELLCGGDLRTVDRITERRGWPRVEVVDRRSEDPRHGLYSERLVELIRGARKVICVLNRTGRARLLTCSDCGEVARCEACGGALARPDAPGEQPGELCCPRCGLARPVVCARCASTVMRQLRIGVTRAREELEVLAGRPVGEVRASTPGVPGTDVLVGTEAVLRRVAPSADFEAVAFVDFDQDLLAPRLRAATEALGLVALASRIVGPAGRVLVQTRMPDHPAVRSAVLADPSLLATWELEVRRSLRMPPYTAIALVSGEAAERYLAGVASHGVEVLGPRHGEWLLKAADAAHLADALAATPRPRGRLRVAVDPARL